MPPEPQPQDPQEKTSNKGVDIDKILLPQKEVRKVESERRVSAGVLLDQEITAGKEGIQNPTQPPRVSTLPAQQSPKEIPTVQPLETYQGAIEQVMKGTNASIVSIAAAEAQRRAQKGRDKTPEAPVVPMRERLTSFFKKFSMIAAGGILLAVATGAIAYLLLRPTTVPVAVAPTAPFISVDDTKSVALSSTEPTRDLMGKLVAARGGVSLSLGLIARLVPSVSSTTTDGTVVTPMNAQAFLSTVAPNIPPNLLRTIRPTYLLGVHVYDTNQPFLILSVDSYQEAFSGMLSWEYYMQNDLAPLFTYVPSPHINPATIPATATTTASSTPEELPFVHATFIDKIVENHDARVLQNTAGDIYLLWTFIDRNTLVITTNGATLREIISRLQNAPVTAVPAQ